MKTFLTAALISAAATGALADSIELDTPMAGASLHDGIVDMAVYWTQDGSAQKVVATYAPKNAQDETGRLLMHLEDGDRVTFGLPGHAGVVYSFARQGDSLRVDTAPTAVQLALN